MQPNTEVIVGGRGSGKTTKLLRWAERSPSNRRVVVPHGLLLPSHGSPHRNLFVSATEIAQSRGANEIERYRMEYAVDEAQTLIAQALHLRYWPTIITVQDDVVYDDDDD